MTIRTAIFKKSSSKLSECPKPDRPEFAFIGRSNVGKSSLINMLCNNNKLAQTSSTPGKTKLINHFNINNDQWYLVDLPGYGFAKTSKTAREKFEIVIIDYITKRKSLVCVFVLIDSRLEMQQIDSEFMIWLAEKEIPFSIVFTKSDKLTRNQLHQNIEAYKRRLLSQWEELPELFITSAEAKTGKEDLMAYIGENLQYFTPAPPEK